MPGQDYPAYFEGGLIGVRATEPIAHRQAFISVPSKCLVTLDMVKEHEQLGPIIDENPDWFDLEGGEEGLVNTFMLFLLFEW